MADVLIELMSEEMPASLIRNSAVNINQQIISFLNKNNIEIKGSEYFYSPKRLLFLFKGVKTINKNLVIKGPSSNAPTKAIEGFANSNNYNVKDLKKHDTTKGEYFFIEKKVTEDDVEFALKNIIENTLTSFAWKRSMRWGSYNLRWLRPLRNILCIYNNKKLDIKINHITSNDFTLSSNPLVEKRIPIKSIDNYFKELKRNKIEINQKNRKQMIISEGQRKAKEKNLKPDFEEELLNEVSNLIEYPNLFLAKFDEKYLNLPSEILITSMKKHQKYFPLYSKKKLSNYFLLVSNIRPIDKGKVLIDGNQRVINARLEDASFFWEKDKNKNFKHKTVELNRVIFHSKLGSLRDKIIRISRLLTIMKGQLNLSSSSFKNLSQAIELCKNDLISEVVKEFPNLQGSMGYYYSQNSGFNEEVSEAIKDHYKPYGPNDDCPKTKISKILALLDKIDTISGFFLIDQGPTSSKDPFALRRAGLGILRIILEGRFSINLSNLISKSIEEYLNEKSFTLKVDNMKIKDKVINFILERYENLLKEEKIVNLLIYSSLKVDKNNINIIDINEKCYAIENFVNTKKGLEFLIAFKRVVNIVSEGKESKDQNFKKIVDDKLLNTKEEKNLYSKLLILSEKKVFNKTKDFEHLTILTKPINDFFDNVKINDNNIKLKNNRLFLLSLIKNKINLLTDFSKIIKGKEL